MRHTSPRFCCSTRRQNTLAPAPVHSTTIDHSPPSTPPPPHPFPLTPTSHPPSTRQPIPKPQPITTIFTIHTQQIPHRMQTNTPHWNGRRSIPPRRAARRHAAPPDPRPEDRRQGALFLIPWALHHRLPVLNLPFRSSPDPPRAALSWAPPGQDPRTPCSA